MFCSTLLYVRSSIAIILIGKRELVALLNLSSWCLVMVEWLLLAVPRGCLRFVIVIFPDHTHLLFLNLSVINSIVSSKIYDKRDDFNFDLVNFPFCDGDVHRSPSYGVYISQRIRFARVCSNVDGVNNRNLFLPHSCYCFMWCMLIYPTQESNLWCIEIHVFFKEYFYH